MKIDVGGTGASGGQHPTHAGSPAARSSSTSTYALSDQSAHKVISNPAYLSTTNPATLTEAALHGATGRVSVAPTDAARP